MSNGKSRNKGKSGEREFVNWLKEKGFHAKRTGYFQVYKEKAGQDHGDIEVEEFPDLHFEIKRKETLGIYATIEQVLRDTKDRDKVPVIAFRRNRMAWWVAFPADEFITRIGK